MDETRAQAYLQLIHTVLTCPNGDEAQILQDNSELLDREFMQACESVAGTLTQQGQDNQANLLRNLARQVGQFLGMNDGGDSDNSEGENPQEYANFILELLQAEQDSNSDIKVIYPMLAGRQHLLNDRFAEILQQVAQNLIAEHPEAIELIVALIGNLSINIYEFPRGNRANNLEIAITGYQIVLNNRQPGSEKYAQTQNRLAVAYSNRIKGLRTDNLELAIGIYEAALTVYTLEDFSEDWAMTQNNLALAYWERISGLRAQNLERAITLYDAALKVFTREDFPKQWATTQNNLALAYSNRINGSRLQNLERAIAFYQAALTVYTLEDFPKKWAMTQNNLGETYRNRINGSRAENLELAIGFFEGALTVRAFEDFPEDWADTKNNLAMTYSNRINGSQANNLERAIVLYEEALTVYTLEDFPEKWAGTQNNLADAYSNKINGSRADNLELAIASYHNALTVRTVENFPEKWAMTQNNLANAYLCRINGSQAQNLERAIAFYQAALTVYTLEDFPEKWAGTQNNLAIAYTNRINGLRTDNLELAIASYHNALTISTREAFPQNHAETLSNLGNLYRSNQQWQLAYDTYAPAIATVEFLRGEIKSGDETKQKLAEEWNKLYLGMVEVCIELEHYTEAIEYVERSKARNLVELFANREIKPKGNIPETVLNELSRLSREIEAEQRRLEIEQINRNSNGGTILGERSLQIDSLTTRRDFTHLTKLRKQLDELIADEITPIDRGFSLTQKVELILYKDIQTLTGENTAILEWYITGDKFFTFIITQQTPTPIIWQSSTEDFEALVNWDNEYRKDYKESKPPDRKPQWKQKLASRLQNLAEILHLDQILKNIPKPCDRLILIPHRFLHLLPLHALPISHERDFESGYTDEIDSSITVSLSQSESCLLDLFPGGVSYAPSCQLLQQAKQRQRPHFSHLFAIANPTKDRYLLELQAANIRDKFKSNDFLARDDANKNAILNAKLSFANCAHFGCHGKFEPDSPLESSLVFANKERLTLLKILNLDLNQCRLVTLSACETGLTKSKTSDEYIGLPFGFLLAGSPSIVSTLWEVDQLASTLLLMRFYDNLETLSTVTALNEAQQWLRNLTSEGLEALLECLKPQIDRTFELLPKKDRTRFVNAPLDGALNRKPFPFTEPHYWAGFTAIGV
ncbi:CHAT domain-containing protein [Microcoleus sp. bin38.metabat.b11b12b14.051]|uniref:CHAT domain-containing protein n=1 Tax=Microcoleus sp. bin38.metabat.b11b12b14.051 TaxID=2742709 RepID=UPI0025D6752E|nr:CHAT domain-containing tetratricopeptide repeat protein [Microcoleus sp. bin38.metabat.b11b12b14.051]